VGNLQCLSENFNFLLHLFLTHDTAVFTAAPEPIIITLLHRAPYIVKSHYMLLCRII